MISNTDSRREGSKLSIVGAGAVGSSLAYAAMIEGVARHIVLEDINGPKVHAEALDLIHGGQFVPEALIEGSDDVDSTADSDVVVITAGAKQQPGQSRLDLAGSTVKLMQNILPPLVERSPDAIFLMVTNPVDVTTQAALKISGLPPSRLFGSGTVLDSSRLRQLIAETCAVATGNVHAYMCGEHGDSETPMWSTASIGGVPILDWKFGNGKCFTGEKLDEMSQRVVNAAYEVIEGKGATNFAIGVSSCRIIKAILRDERAVLPVSRMLTNWHGIGGVCMSVPTIVGARGAVRQLELEVSESELSQLRASADQIRETATSLGY